MNQWQHLLSITHKLLQTTLKHKKLKIHQTQHHFRVIVHMVRSTTSIKENKNEDNMTNQHSYWTIVSFSDRVVVVEECLQPFSVSGLQSPVLRVKFASFNEHKDPLHPTPTHTQNIFIIISGKFHPIFAIHSWLSQTYTHNTNMVVE